MVLGVCKPPQPYGIFASDADAYTFARDACTVVRTWSKKEKRRSLQDAASASTVETSSANAMSMMDSRSALAVGKDADGVGSIRPRSLNVARIHQAQTREITGSGPSAQVIAQNKSRVRVMGGLRMPNKRAGFNRASSYPVSAAIEDSAATGVLESVSHLRCSAQHIGLGKCTPCGPRGPSEQHGEVPAPCAPQQLEVVR